MSEPLPTRLDPAAIEGPLYRRGMENGLFRQPPEPVLEGERDPYVIVIPPPNVTSVLHMGHGLNNTVQDVLIRWRRMEGRASLWVPGTDHAGIATQNVVERRLAEREGKTRFDVGREAFEEEVWEFVDETGGAILDQLKAIGASCDWDRTRFTLDPELSRAVREVFVRLYDKDLIYRGEYIINWCPRCLTALSNEEAEGEEGEGRLHHIRYPFPEEAWGAAEEAFQATEALRAAEEAFQATEALRAAEEGRETEGAPRGAESEGAAGAEQALAEVNDKASARPPVAIGRLHDGRWYLTVSTTRPETMLGDTGVAVHPRDERYAALVGMEVELPLTGRRIPIVADDWVDPKFGTGMVKVTPAHDPNDFEIAQRTGIEVLNILTPDAGTNENVPEAFRGLDRFEARKAVAKALKKEGLYLGDEPHRHTVPRCYRCDTVVEPRLSEQWFVRMEPLARPALEASGNGTVRFHPERWKKVYEHWLENIRDWCISRQLWWGHRIPVWYCRAQGCGEVICALEDPTECPACGSGELEQDPDVLDTWFSSWLWPFSVFHWPEETDDLKAFYPGHTLVTGPDILFFWVARMIMAGYEFMGREPFQDVFLTGMVRDARGRKMSKSLGNGIDPLEVVDRFGADALRYTILSMCGVGTDLHLDHEDLEGTFAPGRNFANKVWNAGRFTLMSVGEGEVLPLEEVREHLTLEDRWILSRLSRTAGQVTRALDRFRIHEAVERSHHFFWGEFADWYLELVKARLRGEEGDESREAARAVLVHAFDGILRLLHPLVPFVTEHLWDRIPWPSGRARPDFLPVAPWPEPDPSLEDADAERAMADFQALVTTVRSLRKEYGVGEGAPVSLVLAGAPETFRASLEATGPRLRDLARVQEIGWGSPDGKGVGASAVLGNGTEVFLPLEGLVDLDQERDRLRKEIQRLEGQLQSTEKKLDNDAFVSKAPEEVVDREREKAATFRDQRDKLQEKLGALVGDG